MPFLSEVLTTIELPEHVTIRKKKNSKRKLVIKAPIIPSELGRKELIVKKVKKVA